MPSGSTSENTPPSRRKRRVALPFLIIFLGGFVIIASRSLFGAEGFALESLIPLMGGGLMAFAIAVMVIRERRDRADSTHKPVPPP